MDEGGKVGIERVNSEERGGGMKMKMKVDVEVEVEMYGGCRVE